MLVHVVDEGTHGCKLTMELGASEQPYFMKQTSYPYPKFPKKLSLLFFNRLSQMASPDLGDV